MQRLLPLSPDAVFVASDAMALGALRALRETNLRVPEDIAITGFDDMPFAARTDPPLTTVRQPIQRMGAVAAETLIDLIAHPNEQPRRVILASSNVGDVLLDPFAGSASSLVAASELGRIAYGFELRAEYVNIAHRIFKTRLLIINRLVHS